MARRLTESQPGRQRQGGARRPQRAREMRWAQDRALGFSRAVVFVLYYYVPVGLAVLAAAIWISRSLADGLNQAIAALLAFFLPVVWGSIILTQHGSAIRRWIDQPVHEAVLMLSTTATTFVVGVVVFDILDNDPLQLLYTGVLMGLVLTVRATVYEDGFVERFLGGIDDSLLTILGSVLTGICMVGIFWGAT